MPLVQSPVTVPYNSAGTELGTDANPIREIVNGLSSTGMTFTTVSVTTSTTSVPGTPLSGRRLLCLSNAGTVPVNLGPDTSVTAGATGKFTFRLLVGETRLIPTDGSVTWRGIADSGTQSVNVTEFK